MGLFRKKFKKIDNAPVIDTHSVIMDETISKSSDKNHQTLQQKSVITSAALSDDGSYIYTVKTNFLLDLGGCIIKNK